MNDHERLRKLLHGSTALFAGDHLPLPQAAEAAGLEKNLLLREAESQRLRLFARCDQVEGYAIAESALRRWSRIYSRSKAPESWEVGSDSEPLVIPTQAQMPAEATPQEAVGPLEVCDSDVPGIANAFLAGRTAEVVVLKWAVPGTVFVPARTLAVGVDQVEVSSHEVDALRTRLAARIPLAQAEAALSIALPPVTHKRASVASTDPRTLSDALAAYVAEGLPQNVSKPDEIRRQEGAVRQLIEFVGDVPLTDVDSALLRRFRSEHLAKFLARENKVRLQYGTTSMRNSIETLERMGVRWDVMTPTERDKRVQWISKMFEWLAAQGWIADDPAIAIRKLSFQTKAQRVTAANSRKRRGPFNDDELRSIFSQPGYRTGQVARPFEYWLSLLAVYGGFRLGEICQLWLSDIRQSNGGTWYVDVNAATPDKELEDHEGGPDEGVPSEKLVTDKSLKRSASARKVPIHPNIIAAGFVEWCDALKAAGYQRVFPELSWEEHKRYTKAPVVWHLDRFKELGMPRDGTKVFHSFRHNFNNALERMTDVRDTARNRLMGHQAGSDVNRNVYLQDRDPDENLKIIARLQYPIPEIAKFDCSAGLASVKAALARKKGMRRGHEDMGPVGSHRVD